MLMLKKDALFWALVLALVASVCKADLRFGSKDSAIVIQDNSFMNIKTPQPHIDGGSLVNTGFGSITGNPIRFNRGSYSFFNSKSDIDAVLTPNSNIINMGNNFITGGDTMIANPGGLSGVSVNVFPGSNILRGQPLFFGPNDLRFQSSSALLAIGVQNTLNTNITLNNGFLFLQDDLRLGDDSVILDSGTVIFNSRRLSLGGKAAAWNGDILWNSALDLQVNSAIILNGNWSFFGESQINGNGNVIDLINGGSIIVLPGSSLRLASVHIKSLGIGNIKIADDATLILTDSIIEMDTNYNIDSGKVLIEGSSTVITKDKLLSFIDGPGGTIGKLIVDRVSLTYDLQATLDNFNIRPPLIQDPTRRHVEIIGNAEIRTYKEDTITYHNYRSQALLQKYAIVAPYRKFVVFPEVNDDASLNYRVTLDGNTNFLGFTITDEKTFIITEGVRVLTTNITLRGFSPKNVKFEPDTKLRFGDKTNITLARDEKLNYKWAFKGETFINGGGQILELGENGVISVHGTNSTLTLESMTIKGASGSNIRCTDPSNKIILKNVKWIQDQKFTYKTGGLDIMEEVTFVGPGIGQNVAPRNFMYASTSPFRILNNSTLNLTRNMIFTYAPEDDNPNLFRLQGPTAALSLNQATIAAPGASGVIIDKGLLVVRDANFVSGTVVFGANLTKDQPSGATIQQI